MRILLTLDGGARTRSLAGIPTELAMRSFPEMPFRTTILGISVDVGEVGIKVIGIVWLAAAVAFVVLAGAALTRAARAQPLLAGG